MGRYGKQRRRRKMAKPWLMSADSNYHDENCEGGMMRDAGVMKRQNQSKGFSGEMPMNKVPYLRFGNTWETSGVIYN